MFWNTKRLLIHKKTHLSLIIITPLYYSVYKAVGIYHAFMLAGCWQDQDPASRQDFVHSSKIFIFNKIFQKMTLLQVMRHLTGLRDPPGDVLLYMNTEANSASETTCFFFLI